MRIEKIDVIPLAILALVQGVHPLVVDDADAGLAVAQRDHPDPEAAAGIVVGPEAARADVAADVGPCAASGEVIDVPHVPPTGPDRGGGVLVVPVDQVEAAAEEGEAACGVEKPAAGERDRLAVLVDDD